MQKPDEDEELETVDQLAARLKVKPSWVYASAAKKRIPVVRVGKYIRFRPSAVLKTLNEPEPTAKP